MKNRCDWVTDDPMMIAYHDIEWGVSVHDERLLLEAIILDGAQAGLSWSTILRKRENYRRAFEGFDPVKVAAYQEEDLKRLLGNAGIVRNHMKIASAVNNAQRFLEVQGEFGAFDKYIWQFVGYKPIVNRWETIEQLPATSPESDAMSADLKKRGFKFVGPTICYAFMQAIGMVNDHLVSCFRYEEVKGLRSFVG